MPSVDECLSVEDLDGWACHENVVVCGAPFYMERTSVHVYVNIARCCCLFGFSLEYGCYSCGACSCATCLCDARASFPHSHAHVSIGENLGKLDVGFLGEERIAFELRPYVAEWYGIDVICEDDGMRIAHADKGGFVVAAVCLDG